MTSEYVLNTLDECVGEQRARFMNEMSEEERHEFVEALQARYIEECMGMDELRAHIPEVEPYLRKAQEACIKTVADFQAAERCDSEGYAGPGGYVNDQGTIWPEDCYSEEPCPCCGVGCVYDADAPNGSADGMCLQCGARLQWENDLGEWHLADAMRAFYVSGKRGSVVQLDDGRYADTVIGETSENMDAHKALEMLKAEADQASAVWKDWPILGEFGPEEMAEYVGA